MSGWCEGSTYLCMLRTLATVHLGVAGLLAVYLIALLIESGPSLLQSPAYWLGLVAVAIYAGVGAGALIARKRSSLQAISAAHGCGTLLALAAGLYGWWLAWAMADAFSCLPHGCPETPPASSDWTWVRAAMVGLPPLAVAVCCLGSSCLSLLVIPERELGAELVPGGEDG
mmetsp:Transcript_62704/g.186924  ORF Transcript_62704/g.186924 Transcript_62704/m.186924 type:complete len:171 (-) Transcript_62704:151-663(-)